MSCPYKDRPDIYEDFILERLPEKEREQFLHHAEECRFCRKELTVQQTLITAIRKTGGEEMKREIRGQIEELRKRPSDFNWSFYLKIAAILLFFVIAPGIIYYYNNLSPDWKSKEQFEQIPYLKGQKSSADSDVPPTGTSRPLVTEDKASSPERSAVESGRDKPEPGTAGGELSRLAPPAAADEMSVHSRETIEREEAELPEEANAARQQADITMQQSMESGKRKAPVGSKPEKEGIRQLSGKNDVGKQSAFSETVSPAGIPESSQVWRFQESGKSINIFLTVSNSPYQRSASGYPLEIPVSILRRDSSGIDLRWTVPADFPLTGSAESRRVTEKNGMLMVRLGPEVAYDVQLTSDTTKAKLLPVNSR